MTTESLTWRETAPTAELIRELSARLVYSNTSYAPSINGPLLALAQQILNEVTPTPQLRSK